ncbi:hypothetical protein PMNALOAF_0980 [Methylobacterium adhaesivum]|uniref:Uncharacterized protein n=1 Tax=Methylobacterium adhaesivum TaxID=333297 RepID=A0ABT8BFF7_9HYPH|nr:hypothetical protein [Methylobacterium adhaesivum]MDN3590869.1 hypothetical protein [Methylobacterium adhaesivum]GJD29743.1 hypothetical protein PMNALOAF_0980 [Methylobacterium adhaesivum]
MIALLTLIGPALVLGFLLGVVVGRLAGPPRRPMARAGAMLMALAVLVAGSLAATASVPGRAGLWVEVGALVLAAYLAGATLAALFTRARTEPSP